MSGDGGTDQVHVRECEREVPSAYSHSGLAEHVSWLLGEATSEIDYPQTVTVTIEVENVE